MSNLTEEMKKMFGFNDFDSKELEKRKRFMVTLKDANDMDIESLVNENGGRYFLPFPSFAKSHIKDINNLINSNKYNDEDAISPKQLIDLAFTAFGMKYPGTASKFLKEAFLRFGRFSHAFR